MGRCIDRYRQWSLGPKGMAVFARCTDRGDYNVRFTGRLQVVGDH